MYPVERALWFIENRLDADISLRAIADSAGVSAHHLARAFAGATGGSLMRYARGRRLTEAARSLAAGAPDILAVALAAGYGSHEAFTRAFGEQFGMTPEACRSIGKLDHLKLVEPIRMDKSLLIDLDEPRFAESGEILIAGLGARYTFAANQGIPNQWQRFAPHIGNLANQAGPETYGVCCNADNSGNFEYITGVEVRDFSDLPDDFATVRISPQRYAVFRHPGHVSMLRRTHYTIWNKCCRRRASSSPTGRALSATARISMREPAPARSKSGCRWDGSDVSGDGRDAGGISRFRSSAAK